MTQHIKIGAQAPRKEYDANGSRTEFEFDFAVFQPSDIEVRVNGAVATTGFAVTLNADGRGKVAFASAPANGAKIVLRRQLIVARQTDFQEGGELRAKTLNDELDFLTAAVQQVEHAAGRNLSRPVGESESLDMTLPSKTARVNRLLGFDSTGAPVALAAGALPEAAALTNWRVDSRDGNGSTRSFALAEDPGLKSNVHAFIDGVRQFQDRYVLVGGAVEFETAPPAGSKIEIAYGKVVGTAGLADSDVTAAKIANGAVTDAKIADVGVAKLTGVLPTSKGGTGASDVAAGRTNLGLGSGDNVAFNQVAAAGTISGANIAVTAGNVPSNGMYLPAANTVGFSTSGTLRTQIDSTGQVSIASSGGTLPTGTSIGERLNVNGQIATNDGTSQGQFGGTGGVVAVGSINNVPVELRVNNASVARVDTAARVIVGGASLQSSPQLAGSLLQVGGTGDANGQIYVGNNSGTGWSFGRDNVSTGSFRIGSVANAAATSHVVHVDVPAVAGANRFITLTASNGGDPAIGSSAGNLALNPAGTVLLGGTASTGVSVVVSGGLAHLSHQGAGSINLRTNAGTSPATQLQVSHVANAVNFVQVQGGTAGNRPGVYAAGSDADIQLFLKAKGSREIVYEGNGHRFQNASGATNFRATDAGGTIVNGTYFFGATTGNRPVWGVEGSDANVGVTLQTKGTGVVAVATGGGEQVRVLDTSSATRYVTLTGSNGGDPAIGTNAGGLRINTYVEGQSSIGAMRSTATAAGGTSAFTIGSAGLTICWGSGAPTMSASQGSLYLRTDGSSTSTRLYVNTNGSTGWTAITTAT